MCNVCAAEKLIDGETLQLRSKFNKNKYEMTGFAADAEFMPCDYKISRNGVWSKTFSSTDLASKAGCGGFETSDRKEWMDKWLDSHFGFRGWIRRNVGI